MIRTILILFLAFPIATGTLYKMIDSKADTIRLLNNVALLCLVLLIVEILSVNSLVSISYYINQHLNANTPKAANDSLIYANKIDSLKQIIELQTIKIDSYTYQLQQRQTRITQLLQQQRNTTLSPANNRRHNAPRQLQRSTRIAGYKAAFSKDTSDIYRHLRPSVGQF